MYVSRSSGRPSYLTSRCNVAALPLHPVRRGGKNDNDAYRITAGGGCGTEQNLRLDRSVVSLAREAPGLNLLRQLQPEQGFEMPCSIESSIGVMLSPPTNTEMRNFKLEQWFTPTPSRFPETTCKAKNSGVALT